MSARERTEEIREAGYRMVEIPIYAPQGAWVESADRRVAAALTDTRRLERIAGAENVEPQMLRKAEHR